MIYYPTVMARYSLFVLKVPLNTKQTNKQTKFQTVGAEDWKARLEKSVLMNVWSSSGMADECKVRLQACSTIQQYR